jgi:hypothetical protein
VRYASALRTIALAALTPLLEKNVSKTLAKTLVWRFGIGSTGPEPSKLDDHRSDG